MQLVFSVWKVSPHIIMYYIFSGPSRSFPAFLIVLEIEFRLHWCWGMGWEVGGALVVLRHCVGAYKNSVQQKLLLFFDMMSFCFLQDSFHCAEIFIIIRSSAKYDWNLKYCWIGHKAIRPKYLPFLLNSLTLALVGMVYCEETVVIYCFGLESKYYSSQFRQQYLQ